MSLYVATCPACGCQHEISMSDEDYAKKWVEGVGVWRVHPVEEIDGHQVSGCIAALRGLIEQLESCVALNTSRLSFIPR